MHKKHLFHLAVTLSIFFALIWVVVLTAKDAQGSDAASFYKGKTIRIVVGYSPGGGFDTFARLVARNFGQHVPGNPKVIVVNMPGAGSLSAANRIYNMASPKGLTIVTFHYSNVPLDFIGDPNIQFDPLKYHWIGSPSIGGLPRTLFIRSDLPIHNLQDLKNSKQTITLGGTGANTASAVAGKFLQQIGYPVRNVLGYPGSSGAMAALERKEVDGRITTQSSVETIYKRFLDEKIVRPILSIGDDPRIKHFPGIATRKDLKLEGEQIELMDFFIRIWRFLRVYAAPPGTPMDRVKVLREAFDKTLQSPKLKEQAERQGVLVVATRGKEIERDVKNLSQTSPKVIQMYKNFLGGN